MVSKKSDFQKFKHYITNFIVIALGSFLAAIAIRVFLFPNNLIDGGVIGLSLILGRLYGDQYISYFLILINLPFIYLAYKYIRKTFVIQMLIAIGLFAMFLWLFQESLNFEADILEIIVFGGVILGAGVGFMIRGGGCTDGTEILAIIINRKMGFTVGQIILFVNIFIFSAYGLIFNNWHLALQSLMTYFVAFKTMDVVIAGLDEVKSVMIITSKPKKVTKIITHELGLGLTVIPGIGGFSGKNRDILFVIIERLDLSELKEIVLREDPSAFMAIENLHEVAYGRQVGAVAKKKKKRRSKM